MLYYHVKIHNFNIEIMNMLEHQKLILENVTFDKHLFAKELAKSLKWLSDNEVLELYHWCNNNYGERFPEVIKKVFETEAA